MQNQQHHEHPITSYRSLLTVLLALLFLTVLTIAISRIDFGGHNNTIVSLFIASCKSTLVLLYFMHLKYERKFFAITFVTSVFILAILIGLTFVDVHFR